MRKYRLKRIVDALNERDLDGVLIYDLLSIRYATDTTNMQLWAANNPFRACLVLADGYMILWNYDGYEFLSAYNPLVKEVRGGASFFYFQNGDRTEEMANAFGDQLASIFSERCGTSRRIAIDKIQIAGLRALDARGFHISNGEEVMEKAKSIKGPDEIRAMKCAVNACEASVAEMRKVARPGIMENDVWSVLHAENIRRGGEWIETRILSSGPRTNPWFQECGPRIIGNNEILAWDTDLIGSYGFCVDISRSWFLGDGLPDPEMKRLHSIALDHIQTNMDELRPGVTFKELSHRGHQLAPEFVKNRYTRFHGVGLCDEWPRIPHPIDWDLSGYDGIIEAGMVICFEAYIGSEDGPHGIKLEDQVLITGDGYENLTSCPFDDRLMGS